MNPYSSLICDDFSVYVYTNTKMELPTRRETVLHFFDSLQKSFPQMTEFENREIGEYVLEEGREEGPQRWATLESRRFSSGYVNPPSLEEADQFHERILEIAPFHLDVHPFDCEALDVVFAFDLICAGNHDEIVAEALGMHPALENLLQRPAVRVINYQPSLTLSLDDSFRLQCRLHLETRTNPYQVRTGQYTEIPISVYFTVRQTWERQPYASFQESYHHQRKLCQEIVDEYIIPSVIRPVHQAISSQQ